MKVLILTQYYPPENAPIAADLATHLQDNGHDVKVLTGYPNYPEGKLFQGYRQKWRSTEHVDGILTLRVPLYIDHSQNALKRIVNYASFAITSASAKKFARDADVIYVYATQMTPAFGPWLWRKRGGSPYVLHVQDLWPDSIIGSSISGGRLQGRFIEAIITPWIRSVYRRSAAIIGIAPTMLKILGERGADQRSLTLVYNWSKGSSSSERASLVDNRDTEGTHILYAGNLGDLQDLETAIEAAAQCKETGLTLTLIGNGVMKEQLQQLTQAIGASNVFFREPVSRTELAQVYSEFDFGLVSLKDLEAFEGTVPSKFQDLLANGLPVIVSVRGDVSAITTDNRIGYVAYPESVEDLARSFRDAASSSDSDRKAMSLRAFETARRLFSKFDALTRIEQLLLEIVRKEVK